MYSIGYDLGSSSIKASIVSIDTGCIVASGKYPLYEMEIEAPKIGWAEQDPEIWWSNLCILTKELLRKNKINPENIISIGISYQMHGLVLVDKNHQILRPSIIWCDSRASEIGLKAFEDLGSEYCLGHLLNSPGNFTASKLRWVKENEPEIFEKIHKWMLPGDFIAMKLTGNINCTISGLSEGIFWDFKNSCVAEEILKYYEIPTSIMPDVVSTFSIQGNVSKNAAIQTGLTTNTIVSYRAGDQPNNALSLKVLHPGEVAATGGTSGVVYGITDQVIYDEQSRINGFAHINHSENQNRIGQLLCINGCGILYSWMRKNIGQSNLSYEKMEEQIKQVPIGSQGLQILPFGNGGERILHDKMAGAQINNLQFNIHSTAHLYRAALEGIAFSFGYGIEILNNIGIKPSIIKVGNDNLFLSQTFTETLANLVQCDIEMYDTNGATGAAKASLVASGYFNSIEEAIQDTQPLKIIQYKNNNESLVEVFQSWQKQLNILIQ